jgi:biotin transport system substrate-specific component
MTSAYPSLLLNCSAKLDFKKTAYTFLHTLIGLSLQVVAGSLFITLCAQVRIPLPITPIPITLQTFAVMMVAVVLGPRLGTLSALAYIAEALIGLPVLSGMVSQPGVLFTVKGGYLVGFAIQAYLVGCVVRLRHLIGNVLVFTGLLLASAVQLICGGLWFAYLMDWQSTLMLGIAPFLPGEILKVLTVMGSLIYGRSVVSSPLETDRKAS